MSYRFAVVGCGSIGKRHIRNLLQLGQSQVVGVDPRPDRRQEAEAYGVATLETLEAALVEGTDVVFVTSPNRYHRVALIQAIQAGCHVFMEKPIDVESNGLADYLTQMDKKGLVGMMGSNWKFHPAFKRMKQVLEEGQLGEILSANIVAGQYLPDWHPWEDYRQMYSAHQELGGGVLLDSHEIDYLTWLLGPVYLVAALAERLSKLEIDTEDSGSLLLKLKRGTQVVVQLDYTHRLYRRSYALNGSEGVMSWDAREKTVRLGKPGEPWVVWEDPPGYDLNHMYLDQTRHFLNCLAGSETPITPLWQGLKVLKVLEAAKLSSKTHQFVRMDEVAYA